MMETAGLTEGLWEAEVNAWDVIKDPVLVFNFQERITRDMIELVLNLPKERALMEMERAQQIVLNHPITMGYFVRQFITGVRCNIAAVVSTLKHYLEGDYSIEDNPDDLMSNAQTAFNQGDTEKTLNIMGQIGVLLLKGKKPDRTVEHQAEESGLRDYLRGAKNVRYVALTNNLGL